MEEIKLTQYSHGAGCGCKISPAILDKMLYSQVQYDKDSKLLVGNESRDDAAVYDLGNGTALISTTDFFMPIVDDAYDFGRIASANAISDVYAMGGKPILAIAILGWPIDKLAPEVAQRVLEGARSICAEAGISLAGGHSIDCPEPVFGLAVNGIVDVKNLKQNSKAKSGDKLFLTKPLGIGVLTTAQKKGILKPEHEKIASQWMTTLNKIGEDIGKLHYVNAMTDVTGFGLLGHLSEMCEGSSLRAVINFNNIPIIPEASAYLALGSIPGGTNRNWASYGHKIEAISDEVKNILCDPQTSGGLLIAIDANYETEFKEFLQQRLESALCNVIGELSAMQNDSFIRVEL